MELNIACIAGDGIGPEIVSQARKVLDRVCAIYGHTIDYHDVLMGGCSIDVYGVPLTQETIDICKAQDAVLMGSIGGNPAVSPWYQLAPQKRPEAGLLALRKALGLFANLRPAYLFEQLQDACPLSVRNGTRSFDLVIVRTAVDTLRYNEKEIERVARKAFEIARVRRKKVTSVDKANVLDTSRLWRQVVHALSKEYPDVTVEDMLVDNCAMQLVNNPAQFDVILTENMFGDILSDEASMITGSIGMLPSASLNETSFGLYEPSHGSAPDIAGKNIANPIATILSAAMMLRYSFGLPAEAGAIENAVKRTLEDGIRSADLMPRDAEKKKGLRAVSCSSMGDEIAARLVSPRA